MGLYPFSLSLSLSPVQFLEIPGSLQDSQLSVWPATPKKSPKAFAWLTGAGVYYGNMTFGDHGPGESLFVEKNLIPYPLVRPVCVRECVCVCV